MILLTGLIGILAIRQFSSLSNTTTELNAHDLPEAITLVHLRSLLYRQRDLERSLLGSSSLVVDIAAHQVTLRGKAVALTPTEFRLLEHLLKHAGMVLTHSQLLTAVWGFAYSEATELLKPAVSRLRQKVEEDPSRPALIQTVHGVGYRLVLAPATLKSIPGTEEG
jgi:DNA-binding response OmpR family regulator